MRGWIVMLVSLSACAASAPASAEAPAKTILELYERGSAYDRKLVENIIGGNENGMAWFQTIVKGKDLYCPPPRMRLTHPQLVVILRQGVEEQPALADKPYGLALLRSLMQVFPCPAP